MSTRPSGGLTVNQITQSKAANKFYILDAARLYAVRKADLELDRFIVEATKDNGQ